MKLSNIVNQLKAIIPNYTADFCTNITITSLVRSGSTVTATTSSAHGLVAGNKATIIGAKTPLTLSSLTSNNGYAMAICGNKHNLTLGNQNVEIAGAAQSAYNGVHDLVWDKQIPVFQIASITINTGTFVATVTTTKPHGFVADAKFEILLSGSAQDAYNRRTTIASVPTSTTFTIAGVFGVTDSGIPAPGQLWQVRQVLNAYTFIYRVSGSPASPATGTITQIYQYQTGYNGVKDVVAAPTATTFTYTIDSTPESPAQGTIFTRLFPTITASVSYDRAYQFYQTKYTDGQSKKWMIVVLSDNLANKNQKNPTDAIDRVNSGETIRTQTYQTIDIYVFLPCGDISDELLYTASRDLAEEYRPHIFHAILGWEPPSNLVDIVYSRLLFAGDGLQEFNGGVYVHRYSFQATNYINTEDAVAPADLSAFRRFEFEVLDDDGVDVMDIEGDVDQQIS